MNAVLLVINAKFLNYLYIHEYSIVQKSWIRKAQISFFVLTNFREKFCGM